MKKECRFIVIIFLAVVVMLWFVGPLTELLNHYSNYQVQNKLLAAIIVRLVIFLVLSSILIGFGFSKFNGIGRKPSVKNIKILIILLVLILLFLIANWSNYINADKQLLILYVLSTLLVGLVEEISFRGLILPLFIKTKINNQNGLYWSVLFTALLFGFAHCLGFINESNFWLKALLQTLFVIPMGFIFGIVMLKTGNIFITVLTHWFVNFTLGNAILTQNNSLKIAHHTNNGLNLYSLIPNLVIVIVVLVGSFFIIRKIDKNGIKQELNNLKI